MYRTIAFTTAVAMLATLPANAAAVDTAELLVEEHYSEFGYEVDLYVTRGVDDSIVSEAGLTDPATGETVDVWSDGTTVWWHGVADGEPIRGSMLVVDFTDPGPQEAALCFTPVTAILCLGIAVALFGGGCAGGGRCPPKDVPTNPPDSSGHGSGGGGDAEEEGDDGDGDGDSDE